MSFLAGLTNSIPRHQKSLKVVWSDFADRLRFHNGVDAFSMLPKRPRRGPSDPPWPVPGTLVFPAMLSSYLTLWWLLRNQTNPMNNHSIYHSCLVFLSIFRKPFGPRCFPKCGKRKRPTIGKWGKRLETDYISFETDSIHFETTSISFGITCNL